MNLLTKKTSWSGIELGMVKIALIAFGIIIGSTWPEVLAPQRYVLGVIFIVFAIWSASIWFREMKKH